MCVYGLARIGPRPAEQVGNDADMLESVEPTEMAMTQICWNLLSLRKWQWPKEMDDLIGPRPADDDPAGRQTCCQLQLIEQKIRQIGARPARLADEKTD